MKNNYIHFTFWAFLICMIITIYIKQTNIIIYFSYTAHKFIETRILFRIKRKPYTIFNTWMCTTESKILKLMYIATLPVNIIALKFQDLHTFWYKRFLMLHLNTISDIIL